MRENRNKRSFNYLIKDLNTIRKIVNDIAIYGCYDRYQLVKHLKISEKKYDNETRRLKNAIKKEYLVIGRGFTKANKIGLKYDRYSNLKNYLIRLYKIKSFKIQDINLHFMILNILYRKDIEDGLDVNEITALLEDNYFSGNYDDITALTNGVRKKIKELVNIGFIIENKKNDGHNTKIYSKTHNMLDDFSQEELLKLYQTLYFFRNEYNISTLSIFIQETIKEFLNTTMPDEDNIDNEKLEEKDNIFLFNNIFLNNVLNEKLIIDLIDKIESRSAISFITPKKIVLFKDYRKIESSFKHSKMRLLKKTKKTIRLRKVNKEITVLPLKILYDIQYGRQYLLSYNINYDKVISYKLQDISKIKSAGKIKLNKDEIDKYISIIDKCWSGTRLDDNSKSQKEKTKLVEIDFNISSKDKEQYIIDRLYKEKRFGKVEKISDLNYKFSINLLKPEEIIPWVRSFGEYATVIESNQHNLKERVENDWKKVKKLYGFI